MENIFTANILIVDDQPANLRVLSTMFKDHNYKVRKAINGQVAIEAISLEIPDLIVLDIKMPDMNGYEVCQRLKSDLKTKDIPVIFISALDEAMDKVKAFQVGGIDYITKPFQEEEVIARINNQLTIQNQKKRLEEEQKKLKLEIQQRKETEAILYQSRALISSILNSSLDAIAALEAVRNPRSGNIEDFRCLLINPVMSEVFRRNPEDLIGKLIFKRFIDKIDPNLFSAFVQIVLTGKSLEKDVSYKSQDELKWYHFIAVKLGDGFAITVRDITERKKLELQLENMANNDFLTGINNRRSFDRILDKEWHRCQREKQPLSFIICDIDYFKKYNDFYGHQQGDECIKKVAQTLKNQLKRASDSVARYGGEEFVIILPNTTQDGAISLIKSIQEAISEQNIPHEKSEVAKIISLSFGLATIIPSPESSIDKLISLTDDALYEAKDNGRNCYIISKKID